MKRRRRVKKSWLESVILGKPKISRRSAVKRSAVRRGSFSLDLEKHVMREIWAVCYLALGVLLFLSIYGQLGTVGDMLNSGLRPVFGWGVYVIPVLAFLISLTLFLSPKIHFGLSKLFGVLMLLASILGIFHLSISIDDLYATAALGSHGGYIGFVSNFFLRALLQIGELGSAVIFIAALLISILMTFEVSLVNALAYLKPFSRERAVIDGKKSDPRVHHPVERGDSDDIDDIEIIKPVFETPIPFSRQSAVMAELEPEVTIKRVDVNEIKSAKHKKTTSSLEWEFPPLDLLDASRSKIETNDSFLKDSAEKIRQKLEQFGIHVTMHDVHVGPTVVQYTLKPAEGVKLSKITALKSDLALALAAEAIRIEAPIPGKSLVGIEVPVEKRNIVHLRGMLESPEFKKGKSKLKLPIGRSVNGTAVIDDLATMPHLLIAGATGAGKSVGINSMLLALLYQNSPADLKLIIIDPKRVEMDAYNAIPHLLTPVITDVEKAATALRWAVSEMTRRYKLLQEAKHRNIEEYNSDPKIDEKLPKVIILVDELADMMMAASKEVEASICRVAQMARAIGMHLIVATQRPSVDVITGLIKANIPGRIAYSVASGVDSRTILDAVGAEDLLGAGDMLYLPGNMSKPMRVQGTYASSDEIKRVTDRVKLTMEPDYDGDITSPETAAQKLTGVPDSKLVPEDGNDPLYNQAVTVVKENRKASASLLQRRLQVGYARAARLLDEMEENGLIGPVEGAKPRKVFVE